MLAAEDGPVPAPLVAVTVNVYACPVVRPETIMGEDAPLAVMLPGLDVTVYCVIAELPISVGAVNVTVIELDPALVAVPIVGAPGSVGHSPCFRYPAY